MFQVLDFTQKDLVAIKAVGKITKYDYDSIIPLIENTVDRFGQIKFFVQFENVTGIKPEAFREDLKAYIKYFYNIEKIAIVVENAMQKLWSNLARPFVSGDVEYFSQEDITKARNWVLE